MPSRLFALRSFSLIWSATLLLGCGASPSVTSGSGTGDGSRFTDARALAADPSGRLYVVDAYAATVTVLGPGGVVLETLGGPGQGDYAFFEPMDADPTNGLSLYVADAGNGRVQQFSARGQLVQTLRIPRLPGRSDPETPPSDAGVLVPGTASGESAGGRPVAVAAGPAGVLYVAEAETGQVQKWNRGRFEETVGDRAGAGRRGQILEPVGLAVGDDGALFVADARRGEVLAFGPLGDFSFSIPAPDVRDVAFVKGRLVVALQGTVQIRAPGGTLIETFPVRTGGVVSAAVTPGGAVWALLADGPVLLRAAD